MLLGKTDRDFQGVLRVTFTPFVLLPASLPAEFREASKARARELAGDARSAGLGVTVVESEAGELFVLASDNESQAVGFARKMLADQKMAGDWFLFLPESVGPLSKENAERTRGVGTLTESGFVLPDGHAVEIVAAYVPVQNSTAYLHSIGRRILTDTL